MSDSDTSVDYCAFSPCLAQGSGNARCPRCGTKYCGQHHKFQDYPRHAAQCGIASATTLERRMLKVLLFPADEDSPKVLETECQIKDDSDNPGQKEHHISFRALLQTSTVVAFPVGPIEQTSPPSRLYVALDFPPDDDAPRNRAAQRLAGGQSHPLCRGTLLGYRACEPVRSLTQFMDVSLQDVPAFTAFFKRRERPPSVCGGTRVTPS
ncbi:hypothetical protein BD414DRAFT_15750 [Trametes punicea]|nr:hypothetical protein BD414DRAFT_15750 [Trametes punicea]